MNWFNWFHFLLLEGGQLVIIIDGMMPKLPWKPGQPQTPGEPLPPGNPSLDPTAIKRQKKS